MWIQFISGQFGISLPLENTKRIKSIKSIKSIKLPTPGYKSAVPKITVNINRASWQAVTKRCICLIFTHDLFYVCVETLCLETSTALQCLDSTQQFLREVGKPLIEMSTDSP